MNIKILENKPMKNAKKVLVEVVKEVPRCITIKVEGGAITSVTGLPEDYAYEIIDHDNH